MNSEELLIPTKIIKSRRKSLSLIIKNNGDFIVRAPIRYDNEKIFAFILQKKDWIIKKRQELEQKPFKEISFSNADQLYLLGRPISIVLTNNSRVKLCGDIIEVPNVNSKQKLIGFLKPYAKRHILERAKLIANLFDMAFTSISISSAKTNWGSCSHNNKLHFTYRLIMCPEDVIDYIVLHELCHTKVKNHSKDFWALVEKCNPLYKAQEKWLKKNRGIMELI